MIIAKNQFGYTKEQVRKAYLDFGFTKKEAKELSEDDFNKPIMKETHDNSKKRKRVKRPNKTYSR